MKRTTESYGEEEEAEGMAIAVEVSYRLILLNDKYFCFFILTSVS